MEESLTPSATDVGRIIQELKKVSEDPKRSRKDREKARRAYLGLTHTVRTSSIQ